MHFEIIHHILNEELKKFQEVLIYSNFYIELKWTLNLIEWNLKKKFWKLEIWFKNAFKNIITYKNKNVLIPKVRLFALLRDGLVESSGFVASESVLKFLVVSGLWDSVLTVLESNSVVVIIGVSIDIVGSDVKQFPPLQGVWVLLVVDEGTVVEELRACVVVSGSVGEVALVTVALEVDFFGRRFWC